MIIWIMNHYAATMFTDQAGRHYWFAKRLREKKHEVTVFTASASFNTVVVNTGEEKCCVKEDEFTKFVSIILC